MAASTPDMTKMAEIMVNACISDDNIARFLQDAYRFSDLARGAVGAGSVRFRGIRLWANPFLPQGGIDKNFGDRG